MRCGPGTLALLKVGSGCSLAVGCGKTPGRARLPPRTELPLQSVVWTLTLPKGLASTLAWCPVNFLPQRWGVAGTCLCACMARLGAPAAARLTLGIRRLCPAQTTGSLFKREELDWGCALCSWLAGPGPLLWAEAGASSSGDLGPPFAIFAKGA